MNEAIKLAQKEGWNGFSLLVGERQPESVVQIAWCDPLFWQALSKALGWGNKVFEAFDGNPDITVRMFKGKPYMYHWHRFIDHIAKGKDADSFFKDLIH